MQIFKEILCFKLCTTTTTKQQQKNKQLIQMILYQLDVGGWQKELSQSHALFLPPATHIQVTQDKLN